MDILFDKKKNFLERIEFIHFYANWVKSVDNKVWSGQQAKLINSLMANTKNFLQSKEEYLDMMEKVQNYRRKSRNILSHEEV